jgi:hypothetical protein
MPYGGFCLDSSRKTSGARVATVAVVLAISVCAWFRPASADFIEEQRFGPSCSEQTHACQLRAKLVGKISAQDATRMLQTIEQLHRKATNDKWDFDQPYVSLNTLGGDVAAAMEIGRLLRKEQASVSIEPGAVCYSACVLILAGAVERNVRGKVGIHRPYFETPAAPVSPDKIRDLYHSMLEKMRSYLRDMDVSEQLADAMLRIEPENMRVLDTVALNAYGLTPEDPIARESKEVAISQRYHLTRAEYVRRKELASANCESPATTCYQKIIETGRVDPRVPPNAIDFSQFGRPAQSNP